MSRLPRSLNPTNCERCLVHAKAMSTLVLLLVGVSHAQDSAASKSKWPTLPAPKPQVDAPRAVFTVKAGEYFIIERDSPAIVVASPDGMIEVVYTENKDGCPVKVKGKFAGGGGKNEDRVLKSKFIIELNPVKSGRCEIFVIPHGVTKESDVERKTVDVDAGDGAQPPPGGGLPPVDPPPTKPTKGYFLIVRPDGPASQDFAHAFALPAWRELVANGHAVKEMTLTESLQYYKAPAGTVIPFVVTLDAANKKVLSGPVAMPTTDEAIRRLKEGVK